MTTIHITHTNADGSPKRVNDGGCWYDTMSEDEFYELIDDDNDADTGGRGWTHYDTFVGVVEEDTNEPIQWQVEAHDITGMKARRKTWNDVVYVVMTRAGNPTWK